MNGVSGTETPGYQVEHLLGRGGMASVYLALHLGMQKYVALKILNPEDAADPALVQRFLAEGRTHATFEHPNIVRVFDVGTLPDGRPYIGMEFLQGQTLSDHIRCSKRLTLADTFQTLMPIFSALEYIHSLGFVHRDIKPENIFLAEGRGPILMDFGIVRAVGSENRHTEVGMSVGTPQYMSPEQARGREVDARTDIYALGVVLFEALSGNVPFDAPDGLSIALRHINDPVPQLEAEPRVQSVVETAMAKNPDQRFASVDQFRSALEALLSGGHTAAYQTTSGGGTAIMSSVATSYTRGSRKSPWLFISLGGGAAILVVAVLLLVSHVGRAHPTFHGGGGGQISPSQVSSAVPPRSLAPKHQLSLAPPARPKVETLAQKVAKLLASGRKHFAARELTSGSNGSALDSFKAVLAIDPNNAEAHRGIEQIYSAYIGLAKKSLNAGELSKASAFATKAETVLSGKIETTHLAQSIAHRKRALLLKPGRVFRDTLRGGGYGPTMVVVPAGRFRMGDQEGNGYEVEKPVHQVKIAHPFAIGVYEITFNQFDRFCRATGHTLPSDFGWGRGNRPVVGVSWNDAVAFTKWLSRQAGGKYRLPTEAEWEYAARGGTQTDFWWGNRIENGKADCLGWAGRWSGKTAPVGSYGKNPFGLYDTVGNVHEWCLDPWHPNYIGAPSNGGVWPGSGNKRVGRGGSWNQDPRNVRVSFRFPRPANVKENYIGFRVVKELR